MKIALIVLATLCMHGLVSMNFSNADGPPLATQCSQTITQLLSCLNFAKGSEKTPTKQCCDSVSNMKEKQPVCLCFFIGQVHNGSDQFTSLGIKEANLLQLPSVCQLTNASVSNCPKLLGISPTSPAAAIFKDNNGTTAGTPGSSSSSPVTTGNTISSGKLVNGGLSTLFVVFVSTIIFALPFINLH